MESGIPFPATRTTWLERQLDAGAGGVRDAVRHVMEVYAEPLRVYVERVGLAREDDSGDLVHGFFVHRLGRPGYLDRWRASGVPLLRRWLVNGVWFHERDRRRAEGRDLDPKQLSGPREHPDAFAAYQSSVAVSMTRRALELAARHCREQGLRSHWLAFERHYYEGLAYACIGPDLGVSAARAAVMARSGVRRFREALRELLERDGCRPEEVDRAIVDLLGGIDG